MISVKESKSQKRDRETRYTRTNFEDTMQGNEFDRMLEDVGFSEQGDPDARKKGGAAGWYTASIPKAGLSPVKPGHKPPLKRTASNAKLTKKWPEQLPDEVDRRFIRSWVRAVPKTFADSVRGS